MKHFLHTLALLPIISFSAHAAQVQVQTQAPAQKYNTNIPLAIAAGSFLLSFKVVQSYTKLKKAKFAELTVQHTDFKNLDPERQMQKLSERFPAAYQMLEIRARAFCGLLLISGLSLATWFYLKFKNNTITTS